ncbi:MAG: RNA polymerase sigma factor [Acidobacteria bacterium]|nr:RNA polymerase sigma factor [Acidobacteriota bacterium]
MMREVKSDRPDAELARLAAGGDAAAFEEIHSRYRRYVYGIALRMTGNEADAEDLTQEAFVAVLRWVGRFRGEASFTTWLYRLVVNQVRMHFRYRRSRPEEQTSDGELLERPPGAAGRADSRQVIDRLAIEKAMRRLPPGYRAAFILHDVEGHDHEEVARLMGWKAGTSKSQLHRARVGLRERLSARAPALQN